MVRRFMFGAALAGAAFAVGSVASADVVVLTFEGLQNLETVEEFYNGGTGGLGSSGTNVGASFSDNARAIIDSDAAGGTGNFGGEPSPSTVLFFLEGDAATLNYAAGFDTGFSFYYSAVVEPASITVYDGLDGTGNVLATLALPLTPFAGAPDPFGNYSPFVAIGVAFNGIAKSIDFGGSADRVAFDNITFGSEVPVGNPVPAPLAVWGGLALLGGMIARRQRSA